MTLDFPILLELNQCIYMMAPAILLSVKRLTYRTSPRYIQEHSQAVFTNIHLTWHPIQHAPIQHQIWQMSRRQGAREPCIGGIRSQCGVTEHKRTTDSMPRRLAPGNPPNSLHTVGISAPGSLFLNSCLRPIPTWLNLTTLMTLCIRRIGHQEESTLLPHILRFPDH